MKKYVAAVIIIGIVAIAAVLIYNHFIGQPQTVVYTYPQSSHIVLAGNLSYPGFYAWQIDCKKGDRVELQFDSTSAVNLYVVPDSAHQTWANTYYHTTNPGLHYPSDQALTSSGQAISTTVSFEAPNDGIFDLVVLNTFNSNPTVTVSGKIYRTE